jgi:hypothetical protein
MKRGTFDTLLSFLLGFAWALLFIGSWLVFKITALFGLPIAFLATLLFLFWMLVCILLLEGLNIYKERADTLKEQTRLLHRMIGLMEKER